MSVRLANAGGRATVLVDGGVVDVERRSGGRFGPDPMAALAGWDAFVAWAGGLCPGDAEAPLDEVALGPAVPRPAKVFAIGVNYRGHVREAGMELPKSPMVFTKFPSCLVGPRADVVLSSGFVDWEVELVAVIGRGGRGVPAARALEHVAGYCVGQDISDRKLQFSDKPPQFCLGKSIDTFGPLGPAVVSLDAFADPDDLAITCDVGGERMQDGRTSDMIFPVAELIAWLAARCTLAPGDIVFTGTPAGVGSTRTPRRYLQAGEVITSAIERVGTLVNRCVSPAAG
jgi:2-keto-4-pentenoate hydratase/2-oxohepta-3-ene-1,7-dioic acid hydratase in catechol pathway